MEGKYIVCKVCGSEFCFSVEEQQFYQDRLLAEPKRCLKCRAARKADLKQREERARENESILQNS